MTAHKLLYKSRPMPDGKFMYIPKDYLEEDYKLIVVDEVSMLPKTLWDLLLSHKVHVLACGDPFHIPPIDKDSDNHILDNPHIFLDEIMRQAAESEIIRVSMDIRNGKPLNYFKGNEVQIIRNEEVVDDTFSYLFLYSLRSRFAREYLSSASAYKTPRIIAAMANKTMKNQYPPLLPALAVMTEPDKVLICPLSSILANLAIEPSSLISNIVPSFDMRYVLSIFTLLVYIESLRFETSIFIPYLNSMGSVIPMPLFLISPTT